MNLNKTKKKELDYTTRFNEERREMIHDFGKGYQVVINFDTAQAYKLKDGEKMSQFPIDGITVKDYEIILKCFAKMVSKI